jgi:hypothetical protein
LITLIYYLKEFDIATRLQAFFQSGALPTTCNTFAVLRCIHQEIIFPVVMKLRQSVYELFPYKDVKGSWAIFVVLIEEKGMGKGVGNGIREVRVFHTKKEQSHDPNPAAHFEFEWAMVLTLAPSFEDLTADDDAASLNAPSTSTSTNNNTNSNTNSNTTSNTTSNTNSNTNNNNNKNTVNNDESDLKLQSVDFWVIDYWLDDGFDKNSKSLLLKVLQKFFHPNTATMYVYLFARFCSTLLTFMLRYLWSKQDIFQVNVSRDFPRLAVKTTITDLDKQLVVCASISC